MGNYKLMPEPVKRRSGSKVGWSYYKTEAEAKKASEIASYNRELQLAKGYDFGYCWPGSIDGPDDEGLYEVCTI